MTFEAFRDHGQPTYYSAVHLAWEADLLVCGLVYCFSIVFLSFCLLVPGIAGKEKFFFILRVFISLVIGASILITNFAMTWETAETTASTQYKAGTGQEVNATIGVNIGLRGVNITLKADDNEIKGETINYNENFNWEGLQGRLGFGPFAGRFNREYRAAQFRGLPLPILWVAEYFTLDGEGVRWGRHYRQAGYYTHVILWLAFPLWVMSNILFFVLLRYGAYFLMLTGLSMVSSNIIWASHRNVLKLSIPFSRDHVLDFSWGPAFWICLVVGLLCIFLGAIVFIMDKCLPKEIALFFGVDVLQDSEKIQVEDDTDHMTVTDKETYSNLAFDDGHEEGEITSVTPIDQDEEDDNLYEESGAVPPPPSSDSTDSHRPNPFTSFKKPRKALKPLSIKVEPFVKRSFKTGEHRLTKRLQRPRRKEPPSDYSIPGTVTSESVNLEMLGGGAGPGSSSTDYDKNMYSSLTRF